MPETGSQDLLRRAKKYSAIKYSLNIIGTLYLLLLLFLFVGSGCSTLLSERITVITSNGWFTLPVYLFIIFFIYSLLEFPLAFYGSFIVEHKFTLSRQNIGDWLLDQVKAGLLSYIFSLIVLAFFYSVLEACPRLWWVIISLFWILFNLILTRLVPLLVIPLFFKYRHLADEQLKTRIFQLAEKMRIKLLDVFEIDFSKKTLKANAAFVGTGKTRRVILADTLKDKYSYDEIEVILAHEFAHYKLKHLLRLVLANAAITAFLFYIIYRTHSAVLGHFGFSSLSDLAALPVVFVYFILFGIVIQPLENWISRRFEIAADKLALEATGAKDAFVSMMNKLASQNLADRRPHPLIKFFFFDHPPIDERIRLAGKAVFNS